MKPRPLQKSRSCVSRAPVDPTQRRITTSRGARQPVQRNLIDFYKGLKSFCSAIIFLAITMAIALFFWESSFYRQPSDIREDSIMGNARDTVGMLTQNSCENSGGTWNECGSACRTTPDSPCIDVCIKYCECVSVDQCPDGYSCEEYVDGRGVCLRDESVEIDNASDTKSEETIISKNIFPKSINLSVPFTSQAPFRNWDMPYQEFCEEASLYMVAQYYEGTFNDLIDAKVADTDLILINELEGSLGFSQDVTINELAILAQAGWNYQTRVIEDPTIEQIKEELIAGRPVIAPMAGRLLGNPYFTAPGPVYHMLVIRGYTDGGKFIVNDPGTYRGEGYLYDFDTIMNAMHDWNVGGEIINGKKIVLVIMPII